MKRALATALCYLLAGALCGAFCVPLASCSGDKQSGSEGHSDRSVTERPEPDTRDVGSAIDESLMIALAQAKNFHHKADVYLREGQLDNAINAVKEILSITFPDGAPEAEDIALDARARLSKLLVVRGQITEAMVVVDEGITKAKRQSFFLANLYTAKGEVFEAMANNLDDAETEGAKAEATEARKKAIEALDRSIAINRELQKSLMNEGGP